MTLLFFPKRSKRWLHQGTLRRGPVGDVIDLSYSFLWCDATVVYKLEGALETYMQVDKSYWVRKYL